MVTTDFIRSSLYYCVKRSAAPFELTCKTSFSYDYSLFAKLASLSVQDIYLGMKNERESLEVHVKRAS